MFPVSCSSFVRNKKNMMRIVLIITLLSSLLTVQASDGLKEKLSKVEILMGKKKYKEAEVIILDLKKENGQANPDFYVEWTYARLMGESGNVKEMDKAFQRTINLYDPTKHKSIEREYVYVNYADYLIRSNKDKEALVQFDSILHKKTTYDVIEYIHPMYSDILKRHKEEDIAPKHHQMLKIMEMAMLSSKGERKKEIKEKARLEPWFSFAKLEEKPHPSLTLGVEGLDDVQPMKAFSTRIAAHLPTQNVLNLLLKFDTDTYNTDDYSNVTIWRWYAANKFQFKKPNLGVTIGAGWVDQSRQKGDYMLDVDLTQEIAKVVSLNAGFSRQVYIGTLASVYEKLVMQNNLYFNVEHKYKNLYIVAIQSQRAGFEDKNNILSIGGWGLVNIPTFPWMRLGLGYGFSYSNAKKMRYVPEVEYDQLLNVYQVGEEVKGVYNPYFTPNKQKIHTGVVSLGFDFLDRFSLNSTVKYALHATTQAPLLYLFQNEEGYAYTEMYYYKAKYNPYDVLVSLNYKLSDMWSFNMFYKQNETFYFKEKRFGVSTTVNF